MTIWQYLLLLAGCLIVVFLACLMPARFFRLLTRVALNAAAGLALLLVLNWVGLSLPLNGLTVAVSGLLGIPGMAAIAALAVI